MASLSSISTIYAILHKITECIGAGGDSIYLALIQAELKLARLRQKVGSLKVGYKITVWLIPSPFLEAFSTVDWSTLCWLKGYFSIIATVITFYFVHRSVAAKSTVSVITQISLLLYLLLYLGEQSEKHYYPRYTTSFRGWSLINLSIQIKVKKNEM